MSYYPLFLFQLWLIAKFLLTDSTTKLPSLPNLSILCDIIPPNIVPYSLCTVSVGEAGFPLCVLSVAFGEEGGEMLFMLIDAFLLYEPRWQSVASLSVIASSSPNTWNKGCWMSYGITSRLVRLDEINFQLAFKSRFQKLFKFITYIWHPPRACFRPHTT